MSDPLTALIVHADCELSRLFHSHAFDLTVTSPPYGDLREYGIDFNRVGQDWLDWAFVRFEASLKATTGPVAWVVNGTTRGGVYDLLPERLQIMLADAGYGVRRSMVYHRFGSLNGGGPSKMPRNVHETIIIATRERKPPPWANLHDAGTPAVIEKAGGAESRFRKDGTRVTEGKRVQPKRAILKDVIECGAVGGGNMGSKFAHENEAAYPEKLVEPIIRAWCPPGGTVFDPFGGSGTTAAVAGKLGRHSVSMDIRADQCELAKRRIEAEVPGVEVWIDKAKESEVV